MKGDDVMPRGPIGGRRGPGIVRTAAKTAVVAGTATATVKAVDRAMGGGQQPAAPAPESTVPAPTGALPTAAGMTDEQIQKLKELAQLRDSGVLTDEEFQVQKQRLLAA
jgi:hypothetical protein